jgi:hypothetical protein
MYFTPKNWLWSYTRPQWQIRKSLVLQNQAHNWTLNTIILILYHYTRLYTSLASCRRCETTYSGRATCHCTRPGACNIWGCILLACRSDIWPETKEDRTNMNKQQQTTASTVVTIVCYSISVVFSITCDQWAVKLSRTQPVVPTFNQPSLMCTTGDHRSNDAKSSPQLMSTMMQSQLLPHKFTE